MDILPFLKNIQANTHSNPIQTSVWTFDVAGRVVSVRVDYWSESGAPSRDYPLQFMPGVQTTARIIDWASGVSYGPRALGPPPSSTDHEPRPPEDPGAF